MLAEINHTVHPPGWWIAAIVITVIAIYVFIKVEHIIVRLLAGLIGLAMVCAVIWWFLLRH